MEELIAVIKNKDVDTFIEKLENYKTQISLLQVALNDIAVTKDRDKLYCKESKVNLLIKQADIILGSIDAHKENFKNTAKKSIKKAKIKEEDLLD